MLDGDLIFDDLNLHGYFLILKPIKMKRNLILMYFLQLLKKGKIKKEIFT
jgi:hypothetical protein